MPHPANPATVASGLTAVAQPATARTVTAATHPTTAVSRLRITERLAMKRALLILALVMLSAVPVQAGVGYWSPSPCRADMEWYRNSEGVWYWQYGWSETNGAKLVRVGYYLDVYAAYGYECGFLGAPRTSKICQRTDNRTFCYQQFEGGQITSTS